MNKDHSALAAQSSADKADQTGGIPAKLLSPYNPQETEARIYKMWEESGLFNPDNTPNTSGQNYCMIMPPPNATGTLHVGHAMGISISDALIRYHRMRGDKTLWLPGTDHAAIATQSKVEKIIKKEENKTRHDLGRAELLKRIGDFVKNSQDSIIAQTKTMGASCDWSRLAFTLDEARNLAVRTTFKKMYDDGIIYRGHRIVNWDPKGQTTISDDEIVYEERKAKFYTFKYSADFPIAISTTRPETKVGDTAVAVNPDDERYKEFVGKEYDLEFCGVKLHIKIIADKEVDKDFGTGALGVTPAHSMIDWQMAERHNLPKVQVIDEYAKMTVAGNLNGKKVAEARENIVEWLRMQNLLIKEEEISQNVSTAERTGGIIEPLPKLQWFIDVNRKFILPQSKIDGVRDGEEVSLKQLMLQVVDNGQIKIEPDYSATVYKNWISNLQDWCISRQIWYGHQIPVWYKGDEIYCGVEAPVGTDWIQDEDTLDTWFSSGLWTFSTLGWPKVEAKDLIDFHPTDLMETGRDLIFFWVARMILMTTYCLGDIPFQQVYMHGMVRDGKGRKMSKSLGNGIDLIDVAEKFGADAGRMALMVGATPGIDTNISEDKIKGYKHFANKLWNISRFVLETVKDEKYDQTFSDWTETDLKLIAARDEEVKKITEELDNLKIHIASDRFYQYTWKIFADQIIEQSKEILGGYKTEAKGTTEEQKSRKQFLLHTLRTILICLHPFIPFVTEEIWQNIPQFKTAGRDFLMVEKWLAGKN